MIIKNNKYKRKENKKRKQNKTKQNKKTKQNHKVFMNFSRTFNPFPTGNFAEKHSAINLS